MAHYTLRKACPVRPFARFDMDALAQSWIRLFWATGKAWRRLRVAKLTVYARCTPERIFPGVPANEVTHRKWNRRPSTQTMA